MDLNKQTSRHLRSMMHRKTTPAFPDAVTTDVVAQFVRTVPDNELSIPFITSVTAAIAAIAYQLYTTNSLKSRQQRGTRLDI